MVQYSELFSQAALAIKSRYQSMTQYSSQLPSGQEQSAPTEETQAATTPVADSYETADKPAEEQTSADQATYDKPSAATENEETNTSEAENDNDKDDVVSVPTEQKSDPDYIKRSVAMKYKMKLQFDLAAFTQTVEDVADGDISVEEFAAAGFGLHAAFDIKGKEIIETNMTDNADPSKMRVKSLQRGMQAGKFSLQAKNFNLRSFFRESTSIASRMHVETVDGYRRAVNKFALRYRMDNSFSFNMLNKFNSQTKQMLTDGADNGTVAGYVDTAGDAAQKVTPEVMATFFDAVDEYLNAAESDLASKADQFFSMATEQLGLSGDLVDGAKSQMLDTISGFFDRVDSALAQLETKFVPGSTELPNEQLMQPQVPLEMDNKTALATA